MVKKKRGRGRTKERRKGEEKRKKEKGKKKEEKRRGAAFLQEETCRSITNLLAIHRVAGV